MNTSIKRQIQKAPENPGVYVFKKKEMALYIGKAVNLKKRLNQYLNKKTFSLFLAHILSEAEKIDFKTTDSEIEALILESQLIKKHQPKYNIMLRDGKQYFYVVFTKEKFSKIFLTHQPWAVPSEALAKEGPFTDGAALKTTLRLLRRIFPYCTCKQKHNNFCLNYHIGKCLGFCCLKDTKSYDREKMWPYPKNIRAIREILNGKKNSVIKSLETEMKKLAKKEEFQEAINLRDEIEKLKRIFENAKIIRDANIRIHTNDTNVLIELKKLLRLPKIPRRIEGYDISNIQGKNATGAMVVFENGQPNKNEYRKFKIRLKQTPDDIAMLKEVLFRRFNHPEWPVPDLILIDGGIGQLNAAIFAIANIAAFSESSKLKNPAIISLAKGKNEVFSTTLKNPIPMKRLPAPVRNLIRQIDSEAHRFAITYYRKIHRKLFLK